MSDQGPGDPTDAPGASAGGWRPPSGPASGGYPPGMPAGMPPGSAAPSHPAAGTVLVLGILGMVLCGLLGPVAWIKGNAALREIDAQPGRFSGRDQVQLGRVLGIIASVLLGVALVFVALMVLLFAVGAGVVLTRDY